MRTSFRKKKKPILFLSLLLLDDICLTFAIVCEFFANSFENNVFL